MRRVLDSDGARGFLRLERRRQVLASLQDDFIEHGRDYDLLADNVYAIDRPRGDGWKTLARQLSVRMPGTWWASKHSLTWNLSGRHVEYCIDRMIVPQIQTARAAAERAGIEKPGWTPGRLARQIVRYIDCSQNGRGNCEQLVDGRQAYLSCLPGEYEEMSLIDVQSCYWQLFSKLPSLRCHFHGNASKIQFYPMDSGQNARFAAVVKEMACAKLVRNAIIGAMRGSDEPAPYYYRGEKRYLRLAGGPNWAAAAVIVRTAWELTQQAASECDSVLTMVDSVCTADLDPPPVWRGVGLTVRRVAHGPADIIRPGVFAVGERASHDYMMGDRNRTFVAMAPPPPYLVGVWL